VSSRRKSPIRKPLPYGPRLGVLKDRASLTKHVRKHKQNINDAERIRRTIIEAVELYDQLVAQRLKTPIRARGAPRKDEIAVLVSSFASAFARTGTSVSRHWPHQQSRFQAFAEPILTDLGVKNPTGWIHKHIKARETNIYHPETYSGIPPGK
jgi:hypothetical protein